jgi:hypothetical protein
VALARFNASRSGAETILGIGARNVAGRNRLKWLKISLLTRFTHLVTYGKHRGHILTLNISWASFACRAAVSRSRLARGKHRGHIVTGRFKTSHSEARSPYHFFILTQEVYARRAANVILAAFWVMVVACLLP